MSDQSTDPHGELLRAAAQGDELAFAELYRQTSSRLYGTAYRILNGTDLARDALQEAFVKVWTEASQFDHEKGRSIHWMLGIQRNICIDMLRRRSTRPLADVDFEDLDIPVAAQEGSSPDVERCVRLLGDMEAKAVMLAVYHGLSHTELASKLNLPLGTIKSTIRRALSKLRICLEPEGSDVVTSH